MKLCFQIPLICIAGAACFLAVAAVNDSSGSNRIRIAVAEEMVGEVNEADAKIAMKGWGAALSREAGVEFEYDPNVISTSEQIIQKIQARTVDTFALTTNQYFQVSALVDPTILVDEQYVQGGEEYLVLVHQDSGIRDVASLRGHTLVVLKHPKMCLAGVWLETFLAASNLGSSESFFAKKSSQSKLAKTVLPVFFKQTDACLVTRRGFSTMCELNPQLGRKLQVVAMSPKLTPSLFGFHKDCPQARRKKMVTALANFYESVSGRQALLLFESSRLMAIDVSSLKPATDLLTSYERLRGKSSKK